MFLQMLEILFSPFISFIYHGYSYIFFYLIVCGYIFFTLFLNYLIFKRVKENKKRYSIWIGIIIALPFLLSYIFGSISTFVGGAFFIWLWLYLRLISFSLFIFLFLLEVMVFLLFKISKKYLFVVWLLFSLFFGLLLFAYFRLYPFPVVVEQGGGYYWFNVKPWAELAAARNNPVICKRLMDPLREGEKTGGVEQCLLKAALLTGDSRYCDVLPTSKYKNDSRDYCVSEIVANIQWFKNNVCGNKIVKDCIVQYCPNIYDRPQSYINNLNSCRVIMAILLGKESYCPEYDDNHYQCSSYFKSPPEVIFNLCGDKKYTDCYNEIFSSNVFNIEDAFSRKAASSHDYLWCVRIIRGPNIYDVEKCLSKFSAEEREKARKLYYARLAPEPIKVNCKAEKKIIDSQVEEKDRQSKLNVFKFVDFSTSTDNNCNLVLTDERYKVVVPDLNAEQYGKWRLSQLKVCSEQIAKILGVNQYRGDQIVHISKIDENQNGRTAYCCYEEPERAIISLSNREQFNKDAFSQDVYWRGSSVNYNYCATGHEIVHRFFNGTKVVLWANEGLATYIDEFIFKRQSPGYYNPPLRTADDLICYSDSYKTFPVEGGGYKKMPFRDLTNNFYDQPMIYSYYTASCFWDHIKKTYGDDKFKKIISNIYKISSKENADFIKDAVVPVTGDKIWAYLKNMGIKP